MAVLDWISDPTLTLEGERVRLRPPKMADHAEWSALRQQSRAFLQPWEPTWQVDDLTRAAFRRRLSLYQRDQDLGAGYAFFVFRQIDQVLVGGITLRNIIRGVAQTGAIGYWVAQPHTRQGYALSAVEQIKRFAFRRLELHRLEAACCPDNAPSRKLLMRAGFDEEGHAKGYLKINGTWRDHILFGMVNPSDN